MVCYARAVRRTEHRRVDRDSWSLRSLPMAGQGSALGLVDGELELGGLARMAVQLDTSARQCARCVESGRTCPSCVQRRRYVWSLVKERGETFQSAARIMSLPVERVRRLVAEEEDRRELARFRCDSIPVQLTRQVIADALAKDPDLTVAEIAHWLDMRQADFERAFLGKAKRGWPKRRVNVSSASRLMIALGRAPNELEGC